MGVLQLITAKDLYIQNITVAEHDGHQPTVIDSFQVKFPNVFMKYPLGAVRVEDQRFKDWDHYKFTIWQLQLNFVVFCASSACGVSVEHLNAKEPMIRSIYRFHVYYHVRRILKILEIPLPYENSFNQYNNPYNHEKFIGICSEYGVSNDLTKWRNQKYFSTWQSRAWETGKPGMSYINENSFSRWIIEKSNGLTTLGLQKLSETVRDYAYLILTSQTSTRGPIVGHEARNLDAKPNIEPNEKRKQDVKPNIKLKHDVKKPDTNKITIEPLLIELNNYEEEKVALILGTTAVFTVWWMFK